MKEVSSPQPSSCWNGTPQLSPNFGRKGGRRRVMQVINRIWILYFLGIPRNWFLSFSQHSMAKICCVHTFITISLLWGRRFYFKLNKTQTFSSDTTIKKTMVQYATVKDIVFRAWKFQEQDFSIVFSVEPGILFTTLN